MNSDFQRRSVEVGHAYEAHILRYLSARGWTILGTNMRHPSGIEIDIVARDLDGELVAIECKGGDRDRPGLRRSDNIWKVLGQTLALRNWNRSASAAFRVRFVVITSAQPNDDEPLAEPLRIAEAEGQLTIIVVPSPDPSLLDDGEAP